MTNALEELFKPYGRPVGRRVLRNRVSEVGAGTVDGFISATDASTAFMHKVFTANNPVGFFIHCLPQEIEKRKRRSAGVEAWQAAHPNIDWNPAPEPEPEPGSVSEPDPDPVPEPEAEMETWYRYGKYQSDLQWRYTKRYCKQEEPPLRPNPELWESDAKWVSEAEHLGLEER